MNKNILFRFDFNTNDSDNTNSTISTAIDAHFDRKYLFKYAQGQTI